jgi:hypothetical protein
MKQALGILFVILAVAGAAFATIYHPPVKYGEEVVIYFSVYDSNSPHAMYETAPAAADCDISKDGGVFGQTSNAPVDEGPTMSVTVTAGEMECKVAVLAIQDGDSPALYGDTCIVIPTFGNASALHVTDLDDAYLNIDLDNVTGTLDEAEIGANAIGASELATDAADEIADETWDEKLNGGGHRIKHSAADYVRKSSGGGDEIILEDGTAQAGTTNTITLEAGSETTDNIYHGCLIAINGGTGLGQSRSILAYNGTTLVATVDKDFVTAPSSDSEYIIYAGTGSIYSHEGTAQAGGASTIQLASTAEAINDIYNGYFIRTLSGTGSGQTRTISDYDGGTLTATVGTAWSPQPDATTVYAVVPGGHLVSDNPSPDPGLTAGDVYEVLTTYDVASVSDVNSTATGITLLATGTVATGGTASTFTLSTDFQATADAYEKGTGLLIQDADDNHWEMRAIESYTSGRVVTVKTPFTFTPTTSDVVRIPAVYLLKSKGRYN